MPLDRVLVPLIIGGLVGLVSNFVVKGKGFGLFGNIALGIVGAFAGSWLLAYFDVRVGPVLLSSILNATLGAVVTLVVLRSVRHLHGLW